MSEATPHEKWAQNLRTKIGQAGGRGYQPPRHVLARLAALLFDQEIEHIDVDLRDVDRRRALVTGAITLFTEHLVVQVQVSDLLVMSSSLLDATDHQGAQVDIRVAPRISLKGVSMLEVKDESAYASVNSSVDWHGHRDVADWPQTGRVTLEYAGLDPVVMPSGSNVAEFQAFLPALLKDLAR